MSSLHNKVSQSAHTFSEGVTVCNVLFLFLFPNGAIQAFLYMKLHNLIKDNVMRAISDDIHENNTNESRMFRKIILLVDVPVPHSFFNL